MTDYHDPAELPDLVTDPETAVVRLRNDGPVPFSDGYAGRRYEVEPGGERIVPFFAMCLWMGHPEAKDEPGDDREMKWRLKEFERLRTKYGVYENDSLWELLAPISTPPPPIDEVHIPDVLANARFPEVRPQLSAWDLFGKRYVTVIDDPVGSHLTPDVQSVMEKDAMAAHIARMQQQIEQMQGQMAVEAGADPTVTLPPEHGQASEPLHSPTPAGEGDVDGPVVPGQSHAAPAVADEPPPQPPTEAPTDTPEVEGGRRMGRTKTVSG